MAKALRVSAKVLLAIPLAVVALVFVVWLALQLRPVRAAILARVLPLAEASLDGSLAVEDVRWPVADRLELRGVMLRDRQGQRAASIEAASINLRLSALFGGRLEISRAVVDGAFAALARDQRKGHCRSTVAGRAVGRSRRRWSPAGTPSMRESRTCHSQRSATSLRSQVRRRCAAHSRRSSTRRAICGVCPRRIAGSSISSLTRRARRRG